MTSAIASHSSPSTKAWLNGICMMTSHKWLLTGHRIAKRLNHCRYIKLKSGQHTFSCEETDLSSYIGAISHKYTTVCAYCKAGSARLGKETTREYRQHKPGPSSYDPLYPHLFRPANNRSNKTNSLPQSEHQFPILRVDDSGGAERYWSAV